MEDGPHPSPMAGQCPAVGRIALVTGASQGLGEAIAKRFARDGMHVVLVARRAEALARVARDIVAERDATSGCGSVEMLVLDVVDRVAVDRALDALLERLGRVDVLVNNAGTNIRKPAASLDVTEFSRLLDLLLVAPFQFARRLAPAMRAARWGRIVSIGSVAGTVALPTGAAYAAAKAGLNQLSRVLGFEWGGDGVTVNVVAPWYVATPLAAAVLADPAYHAAVLAATPAGRLGEPEDVASAVAFLVSSAASWINGAILPLDGGFSSTWRP